MSFWIFADIFEWAAIAGAAFLACCGVRVVYQVTRRLCSALVVASLRLAALLQRPVVDTAIGDDIPEGYDDPAGLARMRGLARLIDNPQEVGAETGPQNDTWLDLEELYLAPAYDRTEENR